MRLAIWLVFQVMSTAAFGCSSMVLLFVVLPLLAFAWLVFVYQMSF